MEEDAEQEKADEATVFDFFQMEEDDIDLLEPSQNEDMNTFVANDDGTDDLDEDEIIAEEKSNEEDDTASNQMESDKMKEEEFVEKSEEEKIQETLPWNFCFVSSAKKSHNRNTALKRHIKVFHPETLAETVHETKTECEESDNIAMALSVQEEASSDVEEETPNNEKPSEDESSLAKKMNDFNDLLDEEGREEDEENEEPIAAGMDEGGDEGELVKSEEPSERLRWNAILSPVLKVRKSE